MVVDTTWVVLQPLVNPLVANRWYTLEFGFNDALGLGVRVIDETTGAQVSYRYPMPAGQTWRFHHWIYAGTAWLDAYREFPGPGSYYAYDDVVSGGQGRGQRTASCVWDAIQCAVY
jgi:hypothetical protein